MKMKTFYENWWAGVEPGIDQFIPVVIGSGKENPVILNSNNWEEEAVNSQWKIAQAAGNSRGGICHIQVTEKGNYRIELSRWPFHLNRKLSKAGPAETSGGTKIRTGKAVPVEFGCVSINRNDPVMSRSKVDDPMKIVFEMNLNKEDYTLQAWFKDKEQKDLCGAYYVRIEKLID